MIAGGSCRAQTLDGIRVRDAVTHATKEPTIASELPDAVFRKEVCLT